jgi:nucleoside diphosphate kinase
MFKTTKKRCEKIKNFSKETFNDMKKLKDKVRENWGKDEMKNGMHSSDSLENVNRESKICLK